MRLAGVETLGAPDRGRQVIGENHHGQAVIGAIGDFDRLLCGFELEYRQHPAQDRFAVDANVRGDVAERGGRYSLPPILLSLRFSAAARSQGKPNHGSAHNAWRSRATFPEPPING